MSRCQHGRLQRASTLLTWTHFHPAHGKVDNCWILLLDKVVLREPLNVEDEVWGECTQMMALERRAKLLGTLADELFIAARPT